MIHVSDGDANGNWCDWNGPQVVGEGGRRCWKSKEMQKQSKLKHC